MSDMDDEYNFEEVEKLLASTQSNMNNLMKEMREINSAHGPRPQIGQTNQIKMSQGVDFGSAKSSIMQNSLQQSLQPGLAPKRPSSRDRAHLEGLMTATGIGTLPKNTSSRSTFQIRQRQRSLSKNKK